MSDDAEDEWRDGLALIRAISAVDYDGACAVLDNLADPVVTCAFLAYGAVGMIQGHGADPAAVADLLQRSGPPRAG
jgi:hypothetical protein